MRVYNNTGGIYSKNRGNRNKAISMRRGSIKQIQVAERTFGNRTACIDLSVISEDLYLVKLNNSNRRYNL